jgi:hypothetical protein
MIPTSMKIAKLPLLGYIYVMSVEYIRIGPKRNKAILKEIRMEGIFDRISKHKSSWIQYADRIQRHIRIYQEIMVSAC